MDNSQIFSRRDTERKVDFRPEMDEGSPYVQARRLSDYLRASVAPAEDITDCTDAMNALREYQYRKIFGGTSHDEFLRLDTECPEHIDWSIRIHEIATESFQSRKPR